MLSPSPEVRCAVDKLLNRSVKGNARVRARGLPQSDPLSPMLVDFDAYVHDAGFPLVRYADDIVLVGESFEHVREALEVSVAAAGRLDMKLAAEDTEVMSFDEGFCFLGTDFGPRYPPAETMDPAVEVKQRPVFVSRQGGRVRHAGGVCL